MPLSRLRRPHMGLCLLVVSLLTAGPARADAYNDAVQLALHGKIAQALQTAREQSERHPEDPQWRFLVGKMLQDSGQREQALQVFSALSQEYPELPEPHNNRAVLLAAAGELMQAREALEMAIRANPDYALAHENLGDVYQKLAEAAHRRARALSNPNRSVPTPKEKAP